MSSVKVNDGICDCCDGSDEWKQHTLPEPVQLPRTSRTNFELFELVENSIIYFCRCDVSANRRYYGLYQAPCKDTCEEEEKELSAVAEEIKEGRRIKEEYLGGQPDDSPHMASGHLAFNFVTHQVYF